jgi:hypothetical protein
MLFLSYDGAAGRDGGEPQGVSCHIEWVLQGQGPAFQSVAGWLGEEGDKWRITCGMRATPDHMKLDWASFLDQHRNWTLPDVIKKLESLEGEFGAAKALRKTRRRGQRG